MKGCRCFQFDEVSLVLLALLPGMRIPNPEMTVKRKSDREIKLCAQIAMGMEKDLLCFDKAIKTILTVTRKTEKIFC